MSQLADCPSGRGLAEVLRACPGRVTERLAVIIDLAAAGHYCLVHSELIHPAIALIDALEMVAVERMQAATEDGYMELLEIRHQVIMGKFEPGELEWIWWDNTPEGKAARQDFPIEGFEW